MKTLTAADVMQNDVLSVNSDTGVVEAARTMLRHKISGLPVIDWSRRLVGILTEGDLLRRSEIGTERHRSNWLELLLGPGRGAEEYTAEHARKVSEVMSDQVVAVGPDMPLSEVVALMEKHHIKRVPVLDGERLIGIVSRADLLRALVDAAAKIDAAPMSDKEIREQILRAINSEQWSPRATINVDVANGVVTLHGCIIDNRERAALTVLAENVPGVAKVVDEMVWIEPLSGMVLEPNATKSGPGAASTGNR